MTEMIESGQLGQRGAQAIYAAFDAYQTGFKAITRRAKERFTRCDWAAMQRDAVERLDLYKVRVDAIVAELDELLADQVKRRALWSAMRAHYATLVAARNDVELAETFFNSVTRRIFATIGVDVNVEFVAPGAAGSHNGAPPIFRAYDQPGSAQELVDAILREVAFDVRYDDWERDTHRAGTVIERRLAADGIAGIERCEMVRAVFYRNKGAYLVGRITSRGQTIPLLIALLNSERGITIDAVLLEQDDVSIVFSFARSYFHVEVDQPRPLIAFLRTIMPLKPIAELYTSLGYNKHGKTELYRDLLNHIAHSDDQFEIAPGERGMVMIVFTLPSFDVVFKIIKDRFSYPKTTTRQDVLNRYQLVFKHDRVGRLIDAQEFEHLSFARDRFAPALLDELLQVAAQSVTVEGDQVVIKHLYTERRMTPLNLYLQQASPEAARAAVIDYGYTIKDLVAANIFPGDILLKNFGVTRHGRVVFYDYDELCLVTDCHFREMPPPRSDEEEYDAEPWFFVGENDVFPSEFQTFLGLPPELRAIFTERHGDLFGVAFWQQMQQRQRAGEVIDVFPYRQSRRLERAGV